MAKRKPVAGWIEPDGNPVVVCDDGTTWESTEDGWREFTLPIPGTAADDGAEYVEDEE